MGKPPPPTVQAPVRAGTDVAEAPYVDNGPRAGPPDALVLDIGGNIGALVLYADEHCLGKGIDLTPAGQPRSHHLHTMIRRRRVIDQDIIAGVYAEVPAGDYVVWGLDNAPLGTVTIAGGTVSEFRGGECRASERRSRK